VLSAAEVRPAVVRPAIAASAREAVRGACVDRRARRADARLSGGTDHAVTVIDRSPPTPRARKLAPTWVAGA
jgi:hypothetical protein